MENRVSKSLTTWLLALALVLVAVPAARAATNGSPQKIIDLADLTAGVDPLTRVSGFGTGPFFPLGILGVPVAGGSDVDGDGFADYAVAHMLDSPSGRFLAGEVALVLGNGTIGEAFDLGAATPRILRISGAGNLGVAEMTGSEIWMGDVTGDGIGDLILCRQNFSFLTPFGPRFGAGAATIVVGGQALRDLADAGTVLDLASPPPTVTLFHLLGAAAFDRLGIWARVGDVDGDGTEDLIVAADQVSDGVDNHHGAVYVVRGGPHLGINDTVDLADFGSTSLAGSIARITPPSGADEFHFGATCQVGDLDGNGRAEVLAGAALNRAGAVVGPFGPGVHATGGPPGGRFYVVWDDSFPPGPWPAAYEVDLESPPGSVTIISGGVQNISFGEEILGGLDYDGDGTADLFVGDLVGDGSAAQDRPVSGVGYVFYRAEDLKGQTFNVDAPPPGAGITKIVGPNSGAIASDTVAHGDFDGDGFGDLLIGSPHANPQGRIEAGAMHIFFGRPGRWPAEIDTAPGSFLPQTSVRVTEIQGALGVTAIDAGDTLCYSAAFGDVDGDGKTDVITNEMIGNGLDPGSLDAGNLLVLGGDFLSPPRDGLGAGAPSP